MKQNHKTLENELNKYLKEEIIKNSKKHDIDLLDLLEKRLLDVRENTIDSLQQFLLKIDPTYFEDPNPVIRQNHPSVDRGSSRIISQPTFEILQMRSPYNKEEHEKLKKANIGFAGFSGGQVTSVILARAGIGHFTLVDPDTFEASNANRQALCYKHTIGKYKADVGKQHIMEANSEADVKVYREWIREDNVDRYFSDSDIIIVGTSDSKARPAIHRFGREKGKPVMNTAWSGWEGQYLTFMPDDPLYEEVLGYSPITTERGAHAAGIGLINSFIANDALKITLGDYENIIRYPNILTINLKRTMPLELRDVRYIKKHANQKSKGMI